VQLKVHLLMIKVADAWMDNGKRDVVSESEFHNVMPLSHALSADNLCSGLSTK
jgi:hypothetical protein